MSGSSTTLSTGDAAQLVGVHRSTVKRWCDNEELSCSVTNGGHRRIALSDLLSFAERRTLECSLLGFNESPKTVWDAVQRAERQNDYDEVVELTYKWLHHRNADDVHSLLAFLYELGWSMSVLFDRLVSSVMYRIGEDWKAGQIHVGDEHRMSNDIFLGLHDLEVPTRINSTDNSPTPIALVGTGPGNRHEMGALMVRLTLEVQGWNTIYLGADVPVREFALQQAKHGVDLICISLTPPEHVPSDAERILETLARLPGENCDYRVALGGQAVDEEDVPDASPFLDARGFSKLTEFVNWIHSFASPVASAT